MRRNLVLRIQIVEIIVSKIEGKSVRRSIKVGIVVIKVGIVVDRRRERIERRSRLKLKKGIRKSKIGRIRRKGKIRRQQIVRNAI